MSPEPDKKPETEKDKDQAFKDHRKGLGWQQVEDDSIGTEDAYGARKSGVQVDDGVEINIPTIAPTQKTDPTPME